MTIERKWWASIFVTLVDPPKLGEVVTNVFSLCLFHDFWITLVPRTPQKTNMSPKNPFQKEIPSSNFQPLFFRRQVGVSGEYDFCLINFFASSMMSSHRAPIGFSNPKHPNATLVVEKIILFFLKLVLRFSSETKSTEISAQTKHLMIQIERNTSDVQRCAKTWFLESSLKRVSHQNKTQDSKIPFLQNCREVNQIKKSI